MPQNADKPQQYALYRGLRDGRWLTAPRIRAISLILLLQVIGITAYLVATSEQYVDVYGRPLGTDFSNIYAAGTFVNAGAPEAPFDPAQQAAREQELFGADTPFFGWHYPPFLLPVAGLLALLPYGWALAVWLAVTFAAYMRVMAAIVLSSPRIGRGHLGLALLAAAAYPAVFVNIGHGHNGFLSAALLGGGLWLLPRRPLLAGIAFGLLVYKPQFGVLLPLALAAGGYWRSFIAAAITVCLLAVAVTAAYGWPVWEAFLASTAFTREVVLEQGNTGWHKIQSLFAWVRMWGGSVLLAYALQGALMLGLAAWVWRLWHSDRELPFKAAGLCFATVLATPYALDYDLMLLAPAVAFYVAGIGAKNFAPWEKTLFAALWLMPLLARSLAEHSAVPVAVPLMLCAVVLLWRRSFPAMR